MQKIVAYHRVSTAKQGRSGLGLDAQRSAIAGYVATRGAVVVGEFTEIESGKKDSRPELAKALHLAKVTGATLVIAKLDRLSRKAAFLFTLRDSGVRFVAVDMPDANEMTIGIMSVIAQHEREAISTRTKEALKVARERLAKQGRRLGNPNGAAALQRAGKGNVAGLAGIKAKADSHADNLAPVVAALRAEGLSSLGAMADALNDRGMLTPRGGRWHKSSVRNLLARIEGAAA